MPGPPSRWNIGMAPFAGTGGWTTTTLIGIVLPGAARFSGTFTVPQATRAFVIGGGQGLATNEGAGAAETKPGVSAIATNSAARLAAIGSANYIAGPGRNGGEPSHAADARK